MGGMFSCHSELKHCKAALQLNQNPMLGTVAHKLNHTGGNELVGGKRTRRYKNKTRNTRRR